MTLQEIKNRFGIIGQSPLLDRAIQKAMQVAPTDISVLVSGESGVGKESIPKIIHHLSHRKHKPLIAVNCGAIPEGTIDSELFGHEKGAFTGATGSRKGYFEEADGGTIFLDEVGELPHPTQVRLLRVLETGEFIRVGSSKIMKTDVRVVAATNVNMQEAIKKEKFREDLFYRLNTVEIHLPPLRERKEDIHLLFRKFALDFAEKYHLPSIRLTPEAVQVLEEYRWPGNIRQLRNLAEQISVIEREREIGPDILRHYLPDLGQSQVPILYGGRERTDQASFSSEREILYKLLFDMKRDLNNLRELVGNMLKEDNVEHVKEQHPQLIKEIYSSEEDPGTYYPVIEKPVSYPREEFSEPEPVEEENLSLQDQEIELIRKALRRNNGKRKDAADELGISERTLYRKIKQYNL
ncbi:MAG: sigma-54 dependent transcriptional regulator [Bacteroidota bacterium]|nr:sigma-54 dependent transcriptional regulator [Bacteroidota bacterium]MDX5405166.1 sigma-54 dependent transcriptional regulator [Bacteroidota bacterium]MDX5426961.1 sigma-54 dependent transcriptional regulator [Bacteroidota bacterium]MDX5448626.1 sigma-54 dependent transcriptional regulator [Bacteroidota bacterium]MDX5504949.1 sigma-54 dependent transcriptional regulator [Bacteroidota bacterium]